MNKLAYWQQLKDPRWQEKRLQILSRAAFTCEMCGLKPEGEALEIHHRYYQKGLMAWEYPDDSLLCLCVECHEFAPYVERQFLSALDPKEYSSLHLLGLVLTSAKQHCVPVSKIVDVVSDFVRSQPRKESQ